MRGAIGLGAILVLGLAVSGAVAQTGDPAWADEVHADLEDGAATHNAWVERTDPSFPGDRLLRDERVTMTVRGDDGSEAVYSFRTDDEMRVSDVERGPATSATVRVFASKPALKRALRAENPVGAFGEAVASGDVRVERVVGVFGRELTLGPADGLLGLLGFAAGAALVGLVGLGTVLSLPVVLLSRGAAGIRAALRRVLGALDAVVGFLAEVITAVSALELLGYDVRARIRAAAVGLRAKLRAVGARLRRAVSANEDSGNSPKRESDGAAPGDDAQ